MTSDMPLQLRQTHNIIGTNITLLFADSSIAFILRGQINTVFSIINIVAQEISQANQFRQLFEHLVSGNNMMCSIGPITCSIFFSQGIILVINVIPMGFIFRSHSIILCQNLWLIVYRYLAILSCLMVSKIATFLTLFSGTLSWTKHFRQDGVIVLRLFRHLRLIRLLRHIRLFRMLRHIRLFRMLRLLYICFHCHCRHNSRSCCHLWLTMENLNFASELTLIKRFFCQNRLAFQSTYLGSTAPA